MEGNHKDPVRVLCALLLSLFGSWKSYVCSELEHEECDTKSSFFLQLISDFLSFSLIHTYPKNFDAFVTHVPYVQNG
jgi:hypothetical protein